MKTDTMLRIEGMQILLTYLGMVEAERFVALLQREPFDYTKWQENLFDNMSIEQIHYNVANFKSENKNNKIKEKNNSENLVIQQHYVFQGVMQTVEQMR